MSPMPTLAQHPVALRRLALSALAVFLGLLAALCFQAWPRADYLDLLDPFAKAAHGDPYFEYVRGSGLASYFPVTYWILAAARSCGIENPVPAFICLSLGGILLCTAAAAQSFPAGRLSLYAGAFFSVLCLASFPLIFGIGRGNLDPLVAAMCFLALWQLKEGQAWNAALLLILPIALKGYPLALSGLFLAQKLWRQALLAALAAAVLNALALASLAGGFMHNWEGFTHGLWAYQKIYVEGDLGMRFCADPLDAMKISKLLFVPESGNASACLHWLMEHYHWLSGIGLMASAAYGAFSHAPFHRRLLALTLAMLLFPDLCPDYRLIHLMAPLFFLCTAEEAWTSWDRLTFICIILLSMPKHYFFVLSDASISCLIDPLLLLPLCLRIFSDFGAWRVSADRSTGTPEDANIG